MAITIEEAVRRLKAAKIERKQLLTNIGFVVEREAKKRAPVRTGTLRRSITSRVNESGNVARVGSNLRYAPFVHFGTRYMRARPFLQDALEASREEIDRLVLEEGGRLITAISNG